MTADERWRHDPWAPPAPVAALTGAVVPVPARVEEPAPAADSAPAAGSVVELPDLDDLRKAELVALATERGLDTSGTRAELIARLRAAAG